MQFVGAIIEHPSLGFLLQQRDNKAPSFPLYWTLFGGAIETGETPRQAIERELSEEINLKPEHITHISQIQKNLQQNGNIQIIFHIQVDCPLESFTLLEGKQMKYVPLKNLFRRRFAYNIKEVLKYFLAASSK